MAFEFNVKENTESFPVPFMGSDLVVFCNNKIFATVDGISLKNHPKEITLQSMMLSDIEKDYNLLTNVHESKLLIVYTNVNNNIAYRVVEGVFFKEEYFNHEIQNKCLNNSYVYNYEKISGYKAFHGNVNQLRSKVFD